MIAEIESKAGSFKVDLNEGIDISIPLVAQEGSLSAWYVDPIEIEAVRASGFVGSAREGGSVNFRNISFNPHGHGTHTECIGHICDEVHSVNQNIKSYFCDAQLVSIEPELIDVDAVITKAQLQAKYSGDTKALVIRSLPNGDDKLQKSYSGTNPPYLEASLLKWLCEIDLKHLLLDLPSVDREVDAGALAGHKAFWNYHGKQRMDASITEMVFVPSAIEDGLYFLSLQFPPFENDASPSRPLLFKPI